MTFQPFLIADAKTGLQLDKPPFLLADDAYTQLNNVYLWRRRFKKKQGVKTLGRLRRVINYSLQFGVTQANGGFGGFLRIQYGLESTGQLEPGTFSATVGPETYTEPSPPDGTLVGDMGGVGTLDYANMIFVVNTIPPTPGLIVTVTGFAYFPGLPVMGLPSRELDTINANDSMGFDTKYAYLYSNLLNKYVEAPTSGPQFTWSGSNSNFFWSQNADSALFTTNFTATELPGYTITGISQAVQAQVTIGAHILQIGDYVFFNGVLGMTEINGLTGQVTAIGATTIDVDIDSTGFTAYTSDGVVISQSRVIPAIGDPIRWYDGSLWSNFTPPTNAGNYLISSLMIFFYRDRLLFLNTVETSGASSTATNHYQRARWSQNGTIYYATNPIPAGQNGDPLAYDDVTPGRGGFNDAPTSERIVSASLIKDQLIVFFESSTWRLRYSGNEVLPFIWERVNSEFGSRSTFSTIPFDVGPITVGLRGIVQSDGVNTLRVDNIIPDEVFNFENASDGPIRVHGIRDFDEQITYWSFPNDDENGTYPNRVLSYNYRDQSWAIFLDSFTCFGNWQSFTDFRWGDWTTPFGQSNFTWGSQTNQSLYPTVIGGNQQGYVLQLQKQTTNDPTLRIDAITASVVDVTPVIITSKDHNLSSDYVVTFTGIFDASAIVMNDVSFQIDVIDADNFALYIYNPQTLTFDIPYELTPITYSGNGEIKVVDNFSIVSKKFNPLLKQDTSCRLGWLDFYVDTTSTGKFIVNLYVDGNDTEPVNAPVIVDLQLPENIESNVVETFLNQYETASQETVWHSLYNDCVGNFFQFEITLSDSQMNDADIYGSDFVLYAIMLHVNAANDRLT